MISRDSNLRLFITAFSLSDIVQKILLNIVFLSYFIYWQNTTDLLVIRFCSKWCSLLKLYFHYQSQVIFETIFRKQMCIRMCIRIYIFNFKKQTSKKTTTNKQEYKKTKETKEENMFSKNRLKKINLRPGWRFFSSPVFPGTRVLFLAYDNIWKWSSWDTRNFFSLI